MRILVSLGNATLNRSSELNAVTALNAGMTAAARGIHALLDAGHRVVVTHGHDEMPVGSPSPNGLRTGVHLEHDEAIAEGLVGYRLEQELRNLSEEKSSFVTVMSQTLVDLQDIHSPPRTCLVGPLVDQAQAELLERSSRWTMQAVDEGWRRVVPCPHPVTTLQLPAIRTLLNGGHSVICAGGGIAVVRDVQGHLSGVDAIVDKDLASAQLAQALEMDAFLIVTDVAGVYDDWSSPTRKLLPRICVDELALERFDHQTMRPKLEAACQFSEGGGIAAIGLVGQELAMLEGRTGTQINRAASLA